MRHRTRATALVLALVLPLTLAACGSGEGGGRSGKKGGRSAGKNAGRSSAKEATRDRTEEDGCGVLAAATAGELLGLNGLTARGAGPDRCEYRDGDRVVLTLAAVEDESPGATPRALVDREVAGRSASPVSAVGSAAARYVSGTTVTLVAAAEDGDGDGEVEGVVLSAPTSLPRVEPALAELARRALPGL